MSLKTSPFSHHNYHQHDLFIFFLKMTWWSKHIVKCKMINWSLRQIKPYNLIPNSPQNDIKNVTPCPHYTCHQINLKRCQFRGMALLNHVSAKILPNKNKSQQLIDYADQCPPFGHQHMCSV